MDFLPPIRIGNVSPFSLCILSLSFGFRCPSLSKSWVSSLTQKCKTVLLNPDWMRSRLHQGRFQLDIGANLITERIVKH